MSDLGEELRRVTSEAVADVTGLPATEVMRRAGRRRWRKAGWLGISVGAAAIAAAGVLGGVAASEQPGQPAVRPSPTPPGPTRPAPTPVPHRTHAAARRPAPSTPVPTATRRAVTNGPVRPEPTATPRSDRPSPVTTTRPPSTSPAPSSSP
jgi:eukaryotic-like serine/threonine-protein kinase